MRTLRVVRVRVLRLIALASVALDGRSGVPDESLPSSDIPLVEGVPALNGR
jgi:hypothetical protein